MKRREKRERARRRRIIVMVAISDALSPATGKPGGRK